MARPRKSDTGDRDTGELVYTCAVELMNEHGYHGTPLREIAKNVGVQMSTLYYYFTSKQSLLFYVMERTTKRLMGEVENSVDPDDSPANQLAAAIEAHVRFHAQYPKESRIAETELRSLEEPNLTKIVEIRDDYEAIYQRIINQGKADDLFTAIDTKTATRSMLISMTEVANWYRPNGRLSLDQVSEVYKTLFLGGLVKRP